MASRTRSCSRARLASSSRRCAAGASLAPTALTSSRPTDSGSRGRGRARRLAGADTGPGARRGSSIHWSGSASADRPGRRAWESDCSRRAGSGARVTCPAPRRATLPHDRRGSGELRPAGAPGAPAPPRLAVERRSSSPAPPRLDGRPGRIRRGLGRVEPPSVQGWSRAGSGARRPPPPPVGRRGGRPAEREGPARPLPPAPPAGLGAEPPAGRGVDDRGGNPPPDLGGAPRPGVEAPSRPRPPGEAERPREPPGAGRSPSGPGRRGGFPAIWAAYRTPGGPPAGLGTRKWPPRRAAIFMRNPAATYSPRGSPPKYHRRGRA